MFDIFRTLITRLVNTCWMKRSGNYTVLYYLKFQAARLYSKNDNKKTSWRADTEISDWLMFSLNAQYNDSCTCVSWKSFYLKLNYGCIWEWPCFQEMYITYSNIQYITGHIGIQYISYHLACKHVQLLALYTCSSGILHVSTT